jgi:hypothetical protein
VARESESIIKKTGLLEEKKMVYDDIDYKTSVRFLITCSDDEIDHWRKEILKKIRVAQIKGEDYKLKRLKVVLTAISEALVFKTNNPNAIPSFV